jgi:hypothetical protein
MGMSMRLRLMPWMIMIMTAVISRVFMACIIRRMAVIVFMAMAVGMPVGMGMGFAVMDMGVIMLMGMIMVMSVSVQFDLHH